MEKTHRYALECPDDADYRADALAALDERPDGQDPAGAGDGRVGGGASTALLGVYGMSWSGGFPYVRFHDEYGEKCSIQISSRAAFENEDGTVDDPLGWIWLGIDDARPQILKSKAQALGMDLPPGEVSGWMPYPIPDDVSLTTRMHLNETQVRGLIARLTLWLETGDFSPSDKGHEPLAERKEIKS